MLTRAVTALALVAGLALAGCGNDSEHAAADPTPSAAASPTEPPGVDTAPPPRPAAQSDSSRSAVAYAGWFAQLIQYALEARNSRVVSQEAFDQAACGSCRS